MLAWELRISQLFSAFTPEAITRRDAYWREDDYGVHNADQNMVMRLRSYDSDGHGYRQEAVMAAGQNAGTFMSGNDNSGDKAAHLTYADVVTTVAQTMNLNVPPGSLLWNSVPFNPTLNPTNNMPAGTSSIEDAFQLAAAQIPGAAASIDDVNDLLGAAQLQTGDFTVDGDVDFTSPFSTYCSLTPQKLMFMNFATIMLFQMIFKGLPVFTVLGVPVTFNPVLLPIVKMAEIRTDTAYTASVSGTIIGSSLAQILLSGVPGMSGALG